MGSLVSIGNKLRRDKTGLIIGRLGSRVCLQGTSKLKVLPASGQHKKMPFGIMAADYKYNINESFSQD